LSRDKPQPEERPVPRRDPETIAVAAIETPRFLKIVPIPSKSTLNAYSGLAVNNDRRQ
jgi:hypothetical protein